MKRGTGPGAGRCSPGELVGVQQLAGRWFELSERGAPGTWGWSTRSLYGEGGRRFCQLSGISQAVDGTVGRRRWGSECCFCVCYCFSLLLLLLLMMVFGFY